MATRERPRFLFEPGRVRVGSHGVGGIKIGGGTGGTGGTGGGTGGRGSGPGKGSGQGKGRGQSAALTGQGVTLATAFGVVSASRAPVVPSAPDVAGIPTDGWIDDSAETWTFAAADAPTYTFTVSGDKTAKYTPGKRLKLTQTTVKYFIVTASAYSNPNTTVTVYGGTDYTLANAAVSLNYHSPVKAPDGFPLAPDKWTVEVSDVTDAIKSTPTNAVWYNPGPITITVPIGCWLLSYQVMFMATRSGVGPVSQASTTLSTTNSSESDAQMTAVADTNSTTEAAATLYRQKVVTVAAKTSYFLNGKGFSLTSFEYRGDYSPTIVRAACAYL